MSLLTNNINEFDYIFDIWLRILVNDNSSGWGHAGHFMASTNFLAEMWLPDIQENYSARFSFEL